MERSRINRLYLHTVPSIEAQTGYQRGIKTAICQDHDVLEQIHQFNFDIDNQAFIQYYEARTGMMISKIENKDLFRSFLTSSDPPPHIKIQKARLQDSWELFISNGIPAMVVPGVKTPVSDIFSKTNEVAA